MTRRTAAHLLASGFILAFACDHSPALARQDRPSDPPRSTKRAGGGGLRMSTAVVCDSIDGYENYVPLKGAAMTSDEKLLVYFRPINYKITSKDAIYLASFNEDAIIRKRGDKQIIKRKEKLLEYTARSTTPPVQVYLKNQISLKGLEPGDYDLTIILGDKLDGGSTSQVVKFKIVAAKEPTPSPGNETIADSDDYSAKADPKTKPKP